MRMRWWAVLVGALVAATPAGAAPVDGRALFQARCAPCHGTEGRGDGPDARFFLPRPRDLHDGLLARHDTADLVGRIREGRSLSLARDPRALDQRLRDADAIIAHLPRMAAADGPAARQGRLLYEVACADCHGPAGVPPSATAGAPPDLTTRAVQDTLDASAVRHTRPGMRTLAPTPTVAQGGVLLAFVRLLSPGWALYTRHCAPCHGDDGVPVADVPAGSRRPTVRIDRAYLARNRPQDLETAVWHMLDDAEPQMPHFDRELDETQVRAIVDYLRRTEPPATSP